MLLIKLENKWFKFDLLSVKVEGYRIMKEFVNL